MSTAALPIPPSRPLERFLRLFTDVRDGEGAQVLLLALNVFLILTAYYVMKPVREALILAQPGGAEIKSYALRPLQAALLLVIVPLYGALARRTNRRSLINRRHALFHRLPAGFLRLARARRECRRRVLPVARHFQPDGHRAVLGLLQRPLHHRRGQAAVRADRLRRVQRRGLRGVHLGPADPPGRRAAADAAGRRRCWR